MTIYELNLLWEASPTPNDHYRRQGRLPQQLGSLVRMTLHSLVNDLSS